MLRAFALNDRASALPDLEALVAQHPDAAPVLLEVADVHRRLARPQDARGLLERARAVAAGDAAVLARIDAALARVDDPR